MPQPLLFALYHLRSSIMQSLWSLPTQNLDTGLQHLKGYQTSYIQQFIQDTTPDLSWTFEYEVWIIVC